MSEPKNTTQVTISGTVPATNAAGSQADGHSVTLGTTADAEASSGSGTVVAILKRLRTLLNAGLPAALVGGRLDVNVGSWLGSTLMSVGQKVMASSVPVVLASDQSAVPVSLSGVATATNQTGGGQKTQVTDASGNAAVLTTTTPGGSDRALVVRGAGTFPVTDNGGSLTTDSTQWPAALVGGRFDVNLGAWGGSTAASLGQKTMANSVPVALASDQSAIPVAVGGPTTANAETSFAINTSVQTFLSSSASRKGFVILNDTQLTLYVKYGSGATLTSIYRIPAGELFIDPLNYTGQVTGIWSATTGGGNAIVQDYS